MSPVIETSRLILRQPAAEDVASIVAGVGSYSVAHYLTVVPHPYDAAMATDWLATLPATPTPGNVAFAIELPGKGMIGCVTLIDKLGYWIAQPFWGQGFVTEAAAALLHWHFAGVGDRTVRSGAHRDNRASLAVQKKLGFSETSREMQFVVSQQREIEHIWTHLTYAAFKASGR